MASIQVRDLPDDLHDALRRRARGEGMTIREYLLGVIERDVALPTKREWLAQVAAQPRTSAVDAAGAVREGREDRDEQLGRAHSR